MASSWAYRRRWVKLLVLRFFRDGCAYRAAYLAYLTLVSLVPMLAVAVTIVSRFTWFQRTIGQWQSWVVENLMVESANRVSPAINQWVAHASTLSFWHLVVFLVITILMMVNISRAFRAIWHTEQHFSWTISFFFYFLILLLSPILLAVIFIAGGVISEWLQMLPWVKDQHYLGMIWNFMAHLLLLIWFILMNWVLPACRVPWRAAVISGISTTIMIWVAKKLFTLFFQYFSTYQEIYGALSVVPIFLIWLYVAWVVILFGALIGHSVARPVALTENT